MALGAGATFAARGFAWEPRRLAALIVQALAHRGFSVVDVISPCVVFRPEDRTAFKGKLTWTNEAPETEDRFKAMARATSEKGLSLGLFFQKEAPTYEDAIKGEMEAAKQHPAPVRGLGEIVAALPGRGE